MSDERSNASKPFNFYSKKEVKNCWKKDSNSSIISLHISAYENCAEGDTQTFDDKNESLKKVEGLIQGCQNFKEAFFGLSSTFQNPFEFPRQQENDKNSKPEVSQFKASQKLRNPKKTPNNGQQNYQTPTMSKRDDRRTSILKPVEENVNSQPTGDIKTKRRVSFHTHRTVKEFEKGEMGVAGTPKNESIHYSGSSEEKSSFFGAGHRPGSALTFTSHQTTDIVINDNNFTMNSTANETIAMFNRVGNKGASPGDEDTTITTEPTIALLGHLTPFAATTTPTRNVSVTLEDQTLAFIEKFVPTEMLTPEARASPKRMAEIYDELSRPVHIISPTSYKNPHDVDLDVSKAFETCTLSPVKHRQECGRDGLNFDLDEGERNEEHLSPEADESIPLPERSHSSTAINSTYVVTAPSRNGMYLLDESETFNGNQISAPINDKTYDVVNSNDENDDIEMTRNSPASSTNSFIAPKYSDETKKKFRRLSDIINRSKRRSSILNAAAASSAANSPAIEEEKSNYLSPKAAEVNAALNLSLAKAPTDKNYSADIYDEPMDTSHKERGNSSADGQDSVVDNFEQTPQKHNHLHSNNGTQLLEDVKTPTKYMEDSNFTMSNPTAGDNSSSSFFMPKPSESNVAAVSMQKSVINESIISRKSAFESEPITEASNFSYGGLPAIDKKYIRKEESPKVNQTPGWSKYSKCLELMKKLKENDKQDQAIPMEDFDEEPNYLHGDSVMLDPTTPKKLLTSMSYQQEYRDRNLEEPTESMFENSKGNVSASNSFAAHNSTNLKTFSTLEHKSFQLSRLGCVERQFAPDITSRIEKVIKIFNELKFMAKDLKIINLPGIDDVLIYDEILVITYYKLIVKIAIFDAKFLSLNGDQKTLEKIEDLKLFEETLENLEKSVDEVVDQLKLTSFTYTKFLDKVTNYLVRLSSTNPEKLASVKKGVLEWSTKVDDLKAVYVQRVNEINQEMKALKENEIKAKALMDRRVADIMQRYENVLRNAMPENR
uniref:Uncharacterized protein n=1 Tax=Panagrolaimus sp. PS1159 TaxID=55785 RepID=A0AC35FWA4_9BILA